MMAMTTNPRVWVDEAEAEGGSGTDVLLWGSMSMGDIELELGVADDSFSSSDSLSPVPAAPEFEVLSPVAHDTLLHEPPVSPTPEDVAGRKRPLRRRAAPKRFTESELVNLDADPDDEDNDYDDGSDALSSSPLDDGALDSEAESEDGAPGGRRASRKRSRNSLADLEVELRAHKMPKLSEMCPEEQRLYRNLQKQVKDLENMAGHLHSLPTGERKKVRNRKASRISRLRKKLSVFDLERRYQEEVQVRHDLEANVQQLRAQLAAVVSVITTQYDPSFTLEASLNSS